MWKHVLIAFAILTAVAAGAAAAQPQAGRPDTLPTDADLRVKQAILASFRALPVQNGIILVPISRRAGVDNIELRDGTVAVNGTVVTGGELRQRLGRDADAILELSYLDVSAQRRLLLPAESQPPAAAPQPPPDQGTASEPREAPPEVKPSGSSDDRVFHRRSNGRVRVGGSITVDEDESVDGAVVAIGGDVYVNGRVREAVVAIGGKVQLGPRADVEGDVTTVGGPVWRDPQATIRGQVNEVEFPSIHFRPIRPWTVHAGPWWDGGPWRSVRLVGTLVRMGLFALLAALVLVLAPRGVERIDRVVRDEPWKAALVGFFAQLFFVPLLVITVIVLVISIIGIPLLVLVPFLVLAFFVALLLGFTGTASAVAHAARDRFSWSRPAPLAMLVVGLLLIWGVTMVGRVLALPGGPIAWAAGVLLLVGFLIEYAAWTVGLGGALLTRFGRTGPLYPPPLPPVPPDVAPPAPDEI